MVPLLITLLCITTPYFTYTKGVIGDLRELKLRRSDVEAAKIGIEEATFNESIALSGYLPQIDMTGALRKIKCNVLPRGFMQLNMRQLIYSFGGPLELHAIARLQTKQSELAYQQLLNKVQFEQEQKILETYQGLIAYDFSQQLQERVNIYGSAVESVYNAGLINTAQRASQRSTLETDQTRVDTTLPRLHTTYAELVAATEEYLPYDYVSSMAHSLIDSSAPLLSIDQLQAIAQSHRPEIAIAQLQYEQEKERAEYFRRTYLPSFSVSGSIIKGAFQSLFLASRVNPTDDEVFFNPAEASTLFWVFALETTIVFDGFGNLYRAMQSETRATKALFDKKRFEITIGQEVAAAHAQVLTQAEELERAQIILTEQEKIYQKALSDHKAGLIAIQDCEAARTEYIAARADLDKQRALAARVESNLRYSIGYP